MAGKAPNIDLFKWKRTNKDQNKKQKKKDNPVNDWVEKVKYTSDKTANQAYGKDIFKHDKKMMKDIIPDDEAIYEAQVLLDSWLKEKTFSDLNYEVEYQHESWSKTTGLLLDAEERTKHSDEINSLDCINTLRCKWLDNDEDDIGYTHMKHENHQHHQQKTVEYTNNILQFDDYTNNDDIDNDLLVNEVLNNMMQKDVVKNIDLGMNPSKRKTIDPKLKMELRHAKVKEQKEARLKVQNKTINKNLTRKEIKEIARQRLHNEEKSRLEKEKLDEVAVQKEMDKIKTQMEEERRKRNEKIIKEKQLLDQVKDEMQRELKKKKEDEKIENERRKLAEQIMRKQIQNEAHEISVKEFKNNMRILHKHFTAWHNLVEEKHINLGKAHTLSDWKLKLRTWNAWRMYFNSVKSNKAAKDFEQNMKEKYRQEKMACDFFAKKILKKCINSWLIYTRYKMEKQIIQLEHENKAKKMAMFLEAASKGLLWNNTEEDDSMKGSDMQKKENKGKNHLPSKYHNNINNLNNERLVKQDFLKSVEKNSEKHLNTNNKKHCDYTMKEKSVRNNAANNINLQATSKRFNKHSTDQAHSVLTTQPDSRPVGAEMNIDLSSVINANSSHSALSSAHSTISSPRSSSLSSRKPQIRSDRSTTKPLHLAMEEREKERKERKSAFDEKKRLKDEQRLQELREKEAQRMKLEEQEKEDRIFKKREEKRLQIEKEEQNQLRLQLLRHKQQIADQHYKKTLLKKYGVEPLIRIVKIKVINHQISEKYSNHKLLKMTFFNWIYFTEHEVKRKQNMADKCYEKILLRRSLNSWLKCRFHLQNLNKLARSYSHKRILRKSLNAWKDYTTDERILMWAKESRSDEHSERRILMKSFSAWTRYIAYEKDERIREKRREELRKKVQTWLPDFTNSNLPNSPVKEI